MGDFSTEVKASFNSEYTKAILNVRYTAGFLAALTNSELEPFQISSAQYNILRILRGAKKPITMSLVKERMIEKSPNATRLADKLCDKGFIERVRCNKDRRAVYVSITNQGLDVLNQITFANAPKHMQNLSKEEVKLLNQLLDKIRD